jgi:hypothetical protein
VRHEETEFVGGPLDGRVIEVLVGMTGQPPKVYEVPVPLPGGGEQVLVYHRRSGADRGAARRTRWVYVHDPEGRRPGGVKWPWSRPT